jgi:hypothetical protein
MSEKSKLKLISDALPRRPEPPQPLGAVGRSLWDRITSSYDISDSGGQQMLFEACAASDRAESLRAQINQDGEVIRTKTGFRDHPLLRHETTSRNFIVKTLSRLGLSVEPIRSPGHPLSDGHGIRDTWRD